MSRKVKVIDDFSGPYEWLSNFHPIGSQTVEHCYQAHKAVAASDSRRILMAASPREARHLGRRLSAVRSDWDEVKDKIMLDLLRLKFKRDGLRSALLATGDSELIEGNWWGDTYWGVFRGKGENRLGKLLMQVRDELRAAGK